MKTLLVIGGCTALIGTAIGSTGLAGRTASDVLLLLCAATALVLARAPEEP